MEGSGHLITDARAPSHASDMSPRQVATPVRMQLPEVSLREVLRILARRKALLIGTVVLLTTLAVVAVSQMTPRYRAETLVLIENRESNVVDIESVISGLSLNSEGINSEVEIIRSRRLAQRVVEVVGLADWPEFAPQREQRPGRLNPLRYLPPTISGYLGIRDREPPQVDAALSQQRLRSRAQSALVDRFLSTLEVTPLGRSFVIAVRFEAQDPELAALVTNTIGDLYIIDQLEAKFEATERATAWLNDRLASLRREVETSESAVEKYRTETGLIQGTKATLVAQQVSELSTQLVIARTELAEAEARLGQVLRLVERGGADRAAELLTSSLIQTLKEQESGLLQREAELRNDFGPRHPTMVNIRAELANLQGRITTEVNKIVETLKSEVNVSRAGSQALEDDLRRLEARAGEANRAEVRLRALEREATASRLLFETFLNRFKETSDQDGLQQPDARIISFAAPPALPSFPNKRIFVALALVTSSLLGLALVFTVEHMDAGFRSSEQIEAQAGVPTLGLIPALTGFGKLATKPEDYVLHKPTSAFADSLRSLRTTLMLSNVDNPPSVILMTSAVPGEGKTAITTSLARLTAGMGQRVLVIDCDIRRPRVHAVFDVSNEGGLVEYMAGELTLSDIIRKDAKSELHFITAGRSTPNSTELLRSEQMKSLLAMLRSQYDLIIVDSPPVLAISDARILSQICDTTVFVVRWRETRREAVIYGMRQLMRSNGRLAGALLSQVNVRKHARYGFGDSGYYYGRYRKYYSG